MNYKIESRETVAKVDKLRASILTVGSGQCVPWHHHSEVTDTIFCIEGPMQVETRNPDAKRILIPGEMTVITPGQPHRVSGVDAGRCKFFIIQGVGNYDFIPDVE
jgi:quercetin dioxygenase-like cupin family protein